MTYLIAAVALAALGLLYAWYLINKPEPAGAHHKPPQPRRRDRRHAEQTADDAYLRKLEEADAERHMETGYESLSAEQAHARGWTECTDPACRFCADPAGPLMPLPPEVDSPCPECGCLPSQPWGCGCSNDDCPCSEPEDPAEVVTPEDQADQLVGAVQPDPEPEPLFDRSQDRWGDSLIIPAVKL
jgi:hypothetical protein